MTMTKEQIADFIHEVVAAGCDPVAVGDDCWLIGDADLPPDEGLAIQPTLEEIDRRYGDRDHLHFEIIDYLHSIGRVYVEDEQQKFRTN